MFKKNLFSVVKPKKNKKTTLIEIQRFEQIHNSKIKFLQQHQSKTVNKAHDPIKAKEIQNRKKSKISLSKTYGSKKPQDKNNFKKHIDTIRP